MSARKLTLVIAAGLVAGGLLLARTLPWGAATDGAHGAAAPCETPEGTACEVNLTGVGADTAQLELGTPRLVEFTSEYCPACVRMEPVMEALTHSCASHPGTIVKVSLDDDSGRALASRYQVKMLPTFLTLDAEGNEVERFVGEHPEAKLALAVEQVRGDACL